MQTLSATPIDRVLRLKQVVEAVGLSKTTIYSAILSGDFPPPLKLHGRSVGWRSSEISLWIASREAQL